MRKAKKRKNRCKEGIREKASVLTIFILIRIDAKESESESDDEPAPPKKQVRKKR
jgi:hypothetical protein